MNRPNFASLCRTPHRLCHAGRCPTPPRHNFALPNVSVRYDAFASRFKSQQYFAFAIPRRTKPRLCHAGRCPTLPLLCKTLPSYAFALLHNTSLRLCHSILNVALPYKAFALPCGAVHCLCRTLPFQALLNLCKTTRHITGPRLCNTPPRPCSTLPGCTTPLPNYTELSGTVPCLCKTTRYFSILNLAFASHDDARPSGTPPLLFTPLII